MRAKNIVAVAFTFTLALSGTLAFAGAASAAGQNRVLICHATGSESNPWIAIEVAAPALSAHDGHGDIIPAPVGGCPTPTPTPEPTPTPTPEPTPTATPEPTATATPEPTATASAPVAAEELAHTGAPASVPIGIAIIIAIVGVLMKFLSRKLVA